MDFASLEPLDGGWSGETFVARVSHEDTQVVRIYVRDPGRAEVDAALLRLVRGLLPVAQVLELRPPPAEGGPGLLITSRLPGERGDLVLPRLGAHGRAELGARVGELVAGLSGMPFSRPGELAVGAGGELVVRPWSGGLVDLVHEAVTTGLATWTPAERSELEAVAEVAEDLLAGVERACLVHSDLNPKNLLVDPDTLEITGLVDWEYAHAGHPFTDLGNVLRFDRAPEYVDAVLAVVERVRGTPAAESLELARAADLLALVDLALRAGQNPVADAAERRLRAIAGSSDLHAS